MNFYETRMGRIFFESQLPKLIAALQDIAVTFKTPRTVLKAAHEIPPDFLAELYHGNYDPSDMPDSEPARLCTEEIKNCQQFLKALASPEVWTHIEQYRSLLDARGVIEREQAFASGFQSAMTMLAAGLSQPEKEAS